MPDLLLATVEYGDSDGPPIVALHGGCKTGQHWERIGTEELASRRWVCPDLRGHGSSPPGEPPWNHAQMARDVVATIDSIGIEDFDLIGHSMGARVAVETCRQFPARVRSVILLDPAVMTEDERDSFDQVMSGPFNDFIQREFDAVDDMIEEFEPALQQLSADAREYAEREARGWMGPTSNGRVRVRCDPDFLRARMNEIHTTSFPSFDDYTGPALLLVAERLPACTQFGQRLLRGQLGPQLTTATIPDTDHTLLWSNFDGTTAEIARFISGSRD